MSCITYMPRQPGFPQGPLFPDVEPDVLAREDAAEVGDWPDFLRRVLPAHNGMAAPPREYEESL